MADAATKDALVTPAAHIPLTNIQHKSLLNTNIVTGLKYVLCTKSDLSPKGESTNISAILMTRNLVIPQTWHYKRGERRWR